MARPVTDVIAGLVTLLGEEATLGVVYSRHNVADLVVPATTVGAVSAIPRRDSEMVSGGEEIVPWDVTVSVRIHSAYSGGVEDSATAASLADIAIEKLRTNLAAIDGCRILDVESDYWRSFAESDTLGAELTVVVLTHDHYTQEA